MAKSGASAAKVFYGRKWLGVLLVCFVPLLLGLLISAVVIDWTMAAVMALPLLLAAYFCATFGWGELVARIVLGDTTFSLRLPRYRGYFPFWPARQVDGNWEDVTNLRFRRVEARIIGLRFDYIAHLVETKGRNVMLFEPLPGDLFWNTKGSGLNLPVDSIVREISIRSGRIMHRDADVRGGGLFRNLMLGGPSLWDHAL